MRLSKTKLGSRKLNNSKRIFKNILLTFAIGFFLIGNKGLASDNVLQAIQVNGVKDSYNIILRSDDTAELKKTIQAPNKMILTLKGLRASKTINTIYNNTSSVDSVVVEPTGEDSVKISIQADNVANAGIHFDTLKTPLGVLDKQNKNSTGEVTLSDPINSYRPVYNNNDEEDTSGFSFTEGLGSFTKTLKNILHNEKISWLVAFGLFTIIVLKGLQTIKGKDSEIRIGLSQSLKDREIEMYRGAGLDGIKVEAAGINSPQNAPTNNYGLRAYQNDSRNPYLTSERQRTQPVSSPTVNAQSIVNSLNKPKEQALMQNTIQNTTTAGLKTALKTDAPARPRTTNIDNIKFLESMTKIYEKNGRKDLAQGLKANMKKAKGNLV